MPIYADARRGVHISVGLGNRKRGARCVVAAVAVPKHDKEGKVLPRKVSRSQGAA